jgi:hypothetical protein
MFAATAATAAYAESNAQAAFEKLKSLQGSWSGKGMEGHSLQVTFRVVSGGSAVMSEIQGEHESDMITVFHLDGDRLLMTHYCGVGNQPRMVGAMSADGKTISFRFLDATNVLSTQPGHMEEMTLNMPDSNHHTEAWDFQQQDGKTEHHALFDLQRVQ